MNNVVLLAQISYCNREDDGDFTTHWQLWRNDVDTPLSNDKGDGMFLLLQTWEQIRPAPFPAEYHWPSEKKAMAYLQRYCKRIVN